MRRISWVGIDLTGDTPRAELHGVGQHRPVTRTIPIAVATDFAASGVPTVIHRPDEPEAADGRLVEVG